MITSSGFTVGGRGGDAKTIISPNTSFGDIITFITYKLLNINAVLNPPPTQPSHYKDSSL